MRETRSSGSVEGVVGNHDPYSDSSLLLVDLSVGVMLMDRMFSVKFRRGYIKIYIITN